MRKRALFTTELSVYSSSAAYTTVRVYDGWIRIANIRRPAVTNLLPCRPGTPESRGESWRGLSRGNDFGHRCNSRQSSAAPFDQSDIRSRVLLQYRKTRRSETKSFWKKKQSSTFKMLNRLISHNRFKMLSTILWALISVRQITRQPDFLFTDEIICSFFWIRMNFFTILFNAWKLHCLLTRECKAHFLKTG